MHPFCQIFINMTKPRIHHKLRKALKDPFVKTQQEYTPKKRSQFLLIPSKVNTCQKVFISQCAAARLYDSYKY